MQDFSLCIIWALPCSSIAVSPRLSLTHRSPLEPREGLSYLASLKQQN